jgi:taurine--2-oxoglutarate transaminase
MNTKEIKKLDRQHVVYSWKAQGSVDPIVIDRAEGIYMWDTDGKRYIDGCSGLLNINIGHGNRHVLEAMKAQMEKLCYVSPGFGTEPKARLAAMVAEVTPADLDYVFFTNAGAEAIENAIKAARWYTGRHKIYARWRSYLPNRGFPGWFTSSVLTLIAAPSAPRMQRNAALRPWKC